MDSAIFHNISRCVSPACPQRRNKGVPPPTILMWKTSHRLEYPADRVSRTRNLRPATSSAHSHYRDRFCAVAVTGAVTLKSLTMI
jgi:hypothetical protein